MNNDDIIILDDWLNSERKKVQLAHAHHKAQIEELRKQIDPTVLRGKRKPTRFFLENEFIKEGYMAKLPKLCTLVYSAVLYHGNTETQIAWPSFSKIQEHTGEKNRNYVANAVRLLVECNLMGRLQAKKGFKTLNLYYFTSVQYWRQFETPKNRRLKLTDSIAQYPNQPLRSIRKQRNRSINGDTLTNQNNKSPNSVTSIGDVLKTRMQKWQMPPPVAIQEPSLHSVVRTAYEGDIPLKEVQRHHQEPPNSPDNAVNLQGNRSIHEDTTDKPVNTGKLRELNDVDNATTEQRMRSISSDTTESPFKNGEKWDKSVDETHNELSLEDIRNDDLGAGTAE